jgi:hypothetical protein
MLKKLFTGIEPPTPMHVRCRTFFSKLCFRTHLQIEAQGS